MGTIQEKGVGVLKKMFIDDIESIELLLAHAIPEGISNVAVPVIVYIAMFFADWKLALLTLCSLPLGFVAMGAMYKQGTSKMGRLLRRGPEDEQHHRGIYQRYGGRKGLQPGRRQLQAV